MANIENFNKENLQVMRSEIKEALKSVSEKYGVGFDMGTFTYDPTTKSFRFSTECVVIAEDLKDNPYAAKISKARSVFKRVHVLYGLKEEDLGKRISANGYIHEVVGINESKKKMPIMLQCLQGPKKGSIVFASKGFINQHEIEEL